MTATAELMNRTRSQERTLPRSAGIFGAWVMCLEIPSIGPPGEPPALEWSSSGLGIGHDLCRDDLRGTGRARPWPSAPYAFLQGITPTCHHHEGLAMTLSAKMFAAWGMTFALCLSLASCFPYEAMGRMMQHASV